MAKTDALGYLQSARRHLGQQPRAAKIVSQIELVEKVLQPATNDTVTATSKLRAILVELEGLPQKPAPAVGTPNGKPLKQSPEAVPLPGVTKAIDCIQHALAIVSEHV